MRVRLILAVALAALGVALALPASAPVQATPKPKQLVREFDSQSSYELLGVSVASPGDLDADGTPDAIGGLETVAQLPGNRVSARAFSGATGAVIYSIPAPPQPGASVNIVASLSDLNNDGRPEFIVGTPNALGSSIGLPINTGIARVFDASGNLLHQFAGPSDGAKFGAAVGSAGDVDGDGIPDIIVGAPGADTAAIYSGDPATSFTLLATLQGQMVGEGFGASVAAAGAVTIMEPAGPLRQARVVVGAPLAAGSGGTAHVGRIDLFGVTFSGGQATTSRILAVAGGVAGDQLGTSVDGGPDLNSDGTPDFLGGAIGTDLNGPPGTGSVRLFSGADGTVLRTIASASTGDMFGVAARFGGACAGATRTVIVGAPRSVDSGTQNITGRVMAYDAQSGASITEITGAGALHAMGMSVAADQDRNGDGETEFLAGAPGVDVPPFVISGGAAYSYSCQSIPQPQIEVTPGPIDFGGVPVGTPQTISVQVRNSGDAALNVANIAFTPNSSSQFTLSGPPAFALTPGATQQIAVTFSPLTPSIQTGMLRILSNDPLKPFYDVAVSGQGLRAVIQVTPASIAYGNVDVGDTAHRTVTVANAGNQPLTVSGIAFAGGTSSDFALNGAPALPRTLAAGQQFSFHVVFSPTAQTARSGALLTSSNDPIAPSVSVPLAGAGVKPNLPPVARIEMDVPYKFSSGMEVHFHGEQSHDPDGTIIGYQWDFGDGGTAAQAAPTHTFTCNGTVPCIYVTRLTVADDGGKSDPTSVSVIVPVAPPIPNAVESVDPAAASPSGPGVVRSRFWGNIRRGGQSLPEGTVIEAWIKSPRLSAKVAETLVQNHLGGSVFAVEVPPELGTPHGGQDGEQVIFVVDGIEAPQHGIWYNATDQRLDLTLPLAMVVDQVSPCARFVVLEICGPQDSVIDKIRVLVDLDPRPPIPDPVGWHTIGQPFRLDLSNATTGQPIVAPGTYQIHISYADAQLAAAGVHNPSSVGLFYLRDGQWTRAGQDQVDVLNGQVRTTLNHASVFALMGQSGGSEGYRVYLPLVRR